MSNRRPSTNLRSKTLDSGLPDSRTPGRLTPDSRTSGLPDSELPNSQTPDLQTPNSGLPDAELPDPRPRTPDAGPRTPNLTTTYYLPPDHLQGDYAELPEEEARHAVQVLRHREGDEIVAVDGAGGWFRLRLTEAGKKRVRGVVVERRVDVGEPAYHLTIGMALLKNQNRFDVFVEKASELGVSRIVPIVTQRTEKQSFRAKRADRLLVAAMKQCGRSRLVEVTPVVPLDELIARSSAPAKLMAHEGADQHQALSMTLENESDTREIVILIGPEGGFTGGEVESAVAAGFKVVSLGPRRLRAETAAIVASAGVMLKSN